MSREIDEKVVQMSFDNKNFESNVSTSLSTIDKLKKSLNFTGSSKGLENLGYAAKNVDMNPLSNAVETVRLKFSALEVMAMTALSNITNSAINAGKRIVSALTIDPIKTGFQEYETQINAVQTILANTKSKGSTLDDVNKALDELNTYADKTIYNFTEMTRNIGTFTAAGVDLDTSVSSIKGIANLAAISGSSSQQASTAMYQLSQALAAGKVSLMDWNSVVNAGMGGELFQEALKRTSRNLGTGVDAAIEKFGSFRESLTQGEWLTTEVLTETLKQLSGAYTEADLIAQGYTESQAKEIMDLAQTGVDAATKVKTFTQLWDTLKEAAQSGWTQSWEIIVGDFEEAKEMLTSVSDTIGAFIGASADARNKVLSDWKELGGRTAIIESIKNVFYGVLDVIKPIKEAFKDIFPSVTGEQLANISKKIQDLTSKFKMSDATTSNLKSTFSGLFSIVSIGVDFITSLGKSIFNLSSGIIPKLITGILSVTGKIGGYITGIRNAIKESQIFEKIFTSIGNVLKPFANLIKSAFGGLTKYFKSADGVTFTKLTNALGTVGDKLVSFSKIVGECLGKPMTKVKEVVGKAADGIADALSRITSPMDKIYEVSKKVFDGISKVISGAMKTISKVFKGIKDTLDKGIDAPESDRALGFLTGGAFIVAIKKLGDLSDSLGNIFSSFKNMFKFGKDATASIKEVLGSVRDVLKSYQKDIQAKTLIKIATAIAILAGSLFLLSTIDSGKLAGTLGAMTVLIGELFGSLTIFEKLVGDKKFNTINKVSGSMIKLSIAVLILAAAMKVVSKLNWNEIAKGLTTTVLLIGTLTASSIAMSKYSGKMKTGSVGIVLFATAITILASAVKKLGQIDVKTLTKGLVSVGVLCGELALFMKATDLSGMGLTKSLGLIALATALMILSKSVETLGNIDVKTLCKGLASIGAILLELVGFIKMTSSAGSVLSTSVGMVILASAILILGKSIEKIGNLSLKEIGKGLLSMAGSLLIIAGAMKMMPKMGGKTASLVILAGAMLILGEAVKQMGSMSWETLGKGLLTLAGSLTILVVALNLMKGTIAGAAALLIVSAALAVLYKVLQGMGSLSWTEIGKGLLVLAGAFVVLGVAGLVLGPLTPVLLGLAGAVALLGLGCLAAGGGILALSAGLSALAVSGAAGIQVFLEGVKGLIGLIPFILEQIGKGIVAILQTIVDAAPLVFEAFSVILSGLINVIIENVPLIAEAGLQLITSLLQSISNHLPEIIQLGADIILGFLNGIANNIGPIVQAGIDIVLNFINGIASKIPDVIDAAFNLIISFIEGLAQAVNDNTPRLVEAIRMLVEAMINGAVELLTGGVSIFLEAGVNLIGGLLSGIGSVVGDVVSAVGNCVSDCYNAIKEKVGDFLEAGGEIISNVASGISGAVGSAVDAVKGVIRSCVEGIGGFASEFIEAGKNLISGLAQGIGDAVGGAVDAVKGAGSWVINAGKEVLGIHSPSRVFKEIGRYTMIGFADGITKYSSKPINAIKDSSDDIINTMKTTLADLPDDMDMNPTIKPIFDMSSVEKGVNDMNGLFVNNPTIALGVNNGALSNISYNMNRRNNTATNDDVVSAINKLQNAVNDLNGDTYNINGVTYDDGSNISNAVKSIVAAARIERRR